jgi:hypothetical protein
MDKISVLIHVQMVINLIMLNIYVLDNVQMFINQMNKQKNVLLIVIIQDTN